MNINSIKVMGLLFYGLLTSSIYSKEISICSRYDTWRLNYKIFDSPILEESNGFLTEVVDHQKIDLVRFGGMLNELIINQKPNEFSMYISNKEFNVYYPGKTIYNEGDRIRKQLLDREGSYYYMLYDVEKSFKKNRTYEPYDAEDIDLRQYLICFNKKLKWRVFYNSKLNVHLVKFSIPDEFLNRFGHFVFVVRKEDDKYILVGF